jgi:hypothetical protein
VRPAAAARRVWAASLTAASSLVGARVPAAQTTGTIDIAVSSVRYDGFLPSGAATFTPVVRWERAAGTLTARGTYLRFQSGRRSLQGLVAASLFTPPRLLPRPWRGEISLSTGGSSYADFASFWHATGEARLHFVVRGGGRGAWIGGTGGRTSYGSASRPVAVAGVGVWARRAGVTVTASANRSFVGDTAYSDLASTLHTSLDRVAVDASIGARLSSRGAGHGVFGEASTTLTLGERTALFVSGGRYPTDPVSGSVAGRYASAGVRLRTALFRPPAVRDPRRLSRSPANGDGGASVTARLDVRPAPDGMVRLVVSVPAAATVELAGDFTDWQPVALRRTVEGAWECVLPIPSGAHRINVRVDGGEWTAPAGTTRVADEFGGDVGIVAVP